MIWASRVTIRFLGSGIAVALVACRGVGEHAPALDLPETGEPVPVERPVGDPLDGRARVEARVVSGVRGFEVLARAPELERAPCAGCHTESIEALQARRPAGQRKAHWNVTLSHAAEPVMSCATCHRAPDLTDLRLLGGAAVPFDHAYEVCAQCHAPQRLDWEGGAHGKRAGGWAPPRAVFNCTECHDPHRPAFGTRWPAQAGRARR